MNLSDTKATLSFSDGSPSLEMPIYKGTVGPDVIDIRKRDAVEGVKSRQDNCGSEIVRTRIAEGAFRSAADGGPLQVAHDIAVRIEQADFGNGDGRQPLLTACLSQ